MNASVASANREAASKHGPFCDIVVIGASAGGVEALKTLVSALPADLPASLFVVLHRGDSPSALVSLLSEWGPLTAVDATDGMRIEQRTIYMAPPDRHLLIEEGAVRVVRGPKENRHRPAIDPLFRSAAWAYGPRVTGVLLTGALYDGTAGLWAIRSCGGRVVVQDPHDAMFAGMPSNALDALDADDCVPLATMGALLDRLVREPAARGTRSIMPRQVALENKMLGMPGEGINEMDKLGKVTPFTCPACHGALWEVDDEHVLRYRCHTGHGFTAGALDIEQDEAIEGVLFSAARALEERAAIARNIAARARGRDQKNVAATFEEKAKRAEQDAGSIHNLLLDKRKTASA
jgi:two-component system chemotaxis response regulator CheB